jgi:hypothetical protein
MDECFACSNTAEYILPCYHKVCNICLHDIITDGLCLCYPDDNIDKQCLTSFKQEDVLPINTDNNIDIDVCSIHNEKCISSILKQIGKFKLKLKD